MSFARLSLRPLASVTIDAIGSAALMNINGRNGLACILQLDTLKQPITLRPLPGLPVIRDLIVDLTQFYNQYRTVKPWLINNDPEPEIERLKIMAGGSARRRRSKPRRPMPSVN